MSRQSSQRSTPYFRHVKDDDLASPSGVAPYAHAQVSGNHGLGITVNSPKRTSQANLSTQVQKSFPGPPNPVRRGGGGGTADDAARRSWDGEFMPDRAVNTEPRWMPGGAARPDPAGTSHGPRAHSGAPGAEYRSPGRMRPHGQRLQESPNCRAAPDSGAPAPQWARGVKICE